VSLFLPNPLKNGGDTCVSTISSQGTVWLNSGYILVSQSTADFATRINELDRDLIQKLDTIIFSTFPQATGGVRNYYPKVPLDAQAILDFRKDLQGWFTEVKTRSPSVGARQDLDY
jgi:hypothetical protein